MNDINGLDNWDGDRDQSVALSEELRSRLAPPLKIGNFSVNSRVLQAPLSGVTDLVFRRLVRRYAP
ncbi:MAG: hypothetical protein AAGA67_12115, partial [Cyanobacteria bacterium P01_F01_bin.153]